MKKVYSLLLLLCLAVAGYAQTTTIFYASGLSGSYTTGGAKLVGSTYTRYDNIIAVENSTVQKQTGYCTFDLGSVIPPGAVISDVEFGVRAIGLTSGSVPPPLCRVYGAKADYSNTGAYTPTQLYNACTGTSPVPAYTIHSGSGVWPTSPGEYTVFHSGPTMPLVQLINDAINVAPTTQKISISFWMTNTNNWVYNFGGELYPTTTSGLHCPYLRITYCFHPVITTATLAPTPICSGQTFTLTGVASGASSYRWRGPNGFNVPLGTTTAVATATSAGVYSLTAYTACGSYNDSTVYGAAGVTSLSVNPSPAALITPTTTVCEGNTIYLSDVTPGGTWITSDPTKATVNGTGTVSAIAAGSPVISYRLGTCLASAIITVNAPPGPIDGPTEVCAGGSVITLSDPVSGGTWSSSSTTQATVHPVSGDVTGVAAGPTTISYFTGACPSVTYPITVNPLPNAITGASTVCENMTTQLSSTTPGGTWSTSNTTLAVVDVNTGLVTGTGATGSGPSVAITYTLPTSCYVTKTLTVYPAPAVVTGPSSACLGDILNLSDATPGGAWSSSDLARATVVPTTGVTYIGTLSGNVNILYTEPTNSCVRVHAITINPPPPAIDAPATICAETVFQLSDDDPAGTWSSSVTTVATVTEATGAGSSVGAGTSTITYTLSATGCYITHTLTVLALPTATVTPSGPTTFCAGGSVVLTAAAGAGYNYIWYSNGTPLPGEVAQTYTSVTTEIVNVRVTDANGCSKLSDSIQVTLIPSVAIQAGGPVVFCQPNFVMLSVPLAPGILYQWKRDGVTIPGATAHNYAAYVNGVYTADLVVPGGCFSTTPEFNVTVHNMPHPPIIFNGTTLNTVNGYINYLWFLNTIAIPGATSTSVAPSVNGQYVVRVTDGNGCVGYSEAYILNLGVDQVSAADISIYPNPANSVVNIVSPVSLKAVISAVDGRTLLEQADAKQMDISKLPNGIYMITLYNNDGDRILVQKLVKE